MAQNEDWELIIWQGLLDYGRGDWAKIVAIITKDPTASKKALARFDDAWGSYETMCRREGMRVCGWPRFLLASAKFGGWWLGGGGGPLFYAHAVMAFMAVYFLFLLPRSKVAFLCAKKKKKKIGSPNFRCFVGLSCCGSGFAKRALCLPSRLKLPLDW